MSKFFTSGIGFITTVNFVCDLSETVLGQYALVLAIVTWMGIVGKAGLSKAIGKHISKIKNQSATFGAAVLTLGTLFVIEWS